MKLMKKVFACTITAVMLTSLLQGQAFADTNGSISVKVTKTDIKADGVFNTGGYASLKIKENYDAYPSDPQAALVDRNGNFIMPYKYTWLEYYYDDGIISLIGDAPYYAYNRNILDEETGNRLISIMEELGIANSTTYIDDEEGQKYISSLEDVTEEMIYEEILTYINEHRDNALDMVLEHVRKNRQG